MSSMIDHVGATLAEDWAEGSMPIGHAIRRAVIPTAWASPRSRCAIAISNHYYFARAIRKDVKGLDEAALANIGWVFPNQNSTGTHVNISGGGLVANAPNRENAIKFLEYLASDRAQEFFSNGNDEYPAVPGIGLSENVASLGLFRQDTINLAVLGQNQGEAQAIYDAIGYK